MRFLLTSSTKHRDHAALILIVAAIIGFFLIGAASVREDSLTIDETAHIVSGYQAIRYASFDINLEHPPLVKIVAALPLLFTNVTYVPSEKSAPNQWEEGNRLLFNLPGTVDTILWRSRLAVLAFNALLLSAIALLAWRTLNNHLLSAALVWFLALDPNVIAHARYVTTDAPVALAVVGLALALLFHARARSRSSLAWIIVFLSLVLLVKFSGLLAFAIGILWFLVLNRKDAQRVRNAVGVTLLPLLITYLLYLPINLNVLPGGLDSLSEQATIPSGILSSWNQNIFLRPIASFAIGAIATAGRSELQTGTSFTQFLDGEGKEKGGWKSYFLFATLYKETPAFLLLLIATTIFILIEKEQRKLILSSIAIPGTLLVGYLLASTTSELNIGIRHFLPVLALVPLCCVITIDHLIGMTQRNGKIILATFVSTLTILQAISAGSTFPYYLSYFNAVSGGWQRGYTHLVDSNLDWGEQLKRLSHWTYAQGIPTVSVDYWGKSPLNAYDPEQRLKPWSVANGRPKGYLAITPMWITHSKWAKSVGKGKEDYSYLETLTPIKAFGGGLWVYNLATP